MKANVRATADLSFQVDAETEEELFKQIARVKKSSSISHVENAILPM